MFEETSDPYPGCEDPRPPVARKSPRSQSATLSHSTPARRHCGSQKLSIQFGRFTYYFKCAACSGNTPIQIGCGKEGHKERIRKDGLTFYRECAECGTRSVFFVNPSAA